MDITIYMNLKKIDALTKAATDEFIKRLHPYCNLYIKNTNICKTQHTGKNVLDFCITTASSSGVRTISSEAFAEQIQALNTNGFSKINYYIGYPKEVTNRYQPFALTTTALDLPMTLVVLCEQIYRAYTINHHITYHK